MKAIHIQQFGGPEVLEWREVPDPVPGDHDVLVSVKAAALNHLDIWVRKGLPGVKLPHVPGSEAAGVVEAVGGHVKDYKPGDRVFVLPGYHCGKCVPCKEGDDSACLTYRLRGVAVPGCFSEKVVAQSKHVLPMPDGLTFEEAASLPLVTITAWRLLISRLKVRPGDTVLIHSAGSGLGSLGIQIAKAAGARVFTTASTEEKRRKALDLGAEMAFDSSQGKFAEVVRGATNGKGVDVIFDHVGAGFWEENLQSLALRGRLGFCGTTTGGAVQTDLRFLFARQITLHGSYMGSVHEFAQALKLVERGTIKAVVDSAFPMAEAAEAHRYLESRQQFGKVIGTT